MRPSSADGFRLSVSSTPACSSAIGLDDLESLGDVYVWGELWSDEGSASVLSSKIDILTPKALESNVVLDVHQIACGVRHIALVTRQGEVFTWGEDSGGRLGHGIEKDVNQPQLVEYLAVTNVDYVSCGEFHTAAISTTGDLFTWGDGSHNAGILGHGTNSSHWIPKRVSGPLEGLQVSSVSCGTWHSGIVTVNGKLFTFGEGKFGVLGHGNRESFAYPKEVAELSGLKTIKVACGVWHTAAIVEVGGSGAGMLSRKLFTWGDGDKYRLGHGNKDPYLLPTSVFSMMDYNFQQIGCGHTMTIALTTSGHVFTMGSSSNGQLGNPQADGRSPCMVQDKLVGEFVEEISCGSYHVAVLTSRSEVFTWGKGANGRLGHGDMENRRNPTLVEALRDKHVKSISCGSSFTSTICIHKWVSGADQSVCSGCRQAFGFTRKRHNCYNCGLVHCHACSSKKALRAALAPTPSKPHRVCDACYNKLKAPGVISVSNFNKKVTAPRRSIDSGRERFDNELRSSRILPSPIIEPVKYLEVRSQKHGVISDSVSFVRAAQVPALRQLKDIAFPSSLSTLQCATRPITVPTSGPILSGPSSGPARPSSPFSRRGSSPPRSSPSLLSRSVIDSLKKSNEHLSQEVAKLQNQVKSIKDSHKGQDEEIYKLQKSAKQATELATEQSSKCRIAKEVIKSITNQLKEISGKLPSDVRESEGFQAIEKEATHFLEASDNLASIPRHSLPVGAEASNQQRSGRGRAHEGSNDTSYSSTPNIRESDPSDPSPSTSNAVSAPSSSTANRSKTHEGSEDFEQFEPGVFVKFLPLPNGTKLYTGIKFSRRYFSGKEAEEWWTNNKERVLRKYPPTPLRPRTVAQQTDHTSASSSGEEITSEATTSGS